MRNKVITLLIVATCFASSIQAGPKLDIANNRFNFGQTPQFSLLTTGFWLRSTGDDTLKISEIKTGCSCVLAPLDRDWIAPGDSMLLSLFWDVKAKLGNSGKYPYIYTNAQDDPFRVYMDAQIIRNPDSAKIFFFRPYKIELAKVGSKIYDSLSFEINNKFEHDLTLKVVSPPSRKFDLYIPEIIPALGKITGYIKIRDGYSEAEFTESFTVEASNPTSSLMTIPVRYKILGK